MLTDSTGNKAAWMAASHKSAFVCKQPFARGHNLRVTFKIYGYNGQPHALYGPWQSTNTIDFAASEYDGIFHLCGGHHVWPLPPRQSDICRLGREQPGHQHLVRARRAGRPWTTPSMSHGTPR